MSQEKNSSKSQLAQAEAGSAYNQSQQLASTCVCKQERAAAQASGTSGTSCTDQSA